MSAISSVDYSKRCENCGSYVNAYVCAGSPYIKHYQCLCGVYWQVSLMDEVDYRCPLCGGTCGRP